MNDLGRLSDAELIKIAREQLNEDPSRRAADIKAIKDWIKKQPHLHGNVCTDDNFILCFLRGCKFSLERTKSKFDLFYSIKTACPEWFENWNIEDPIIKELIQLGCFVPLQGHDKHGRKVLLMRGGKLDPSKHNLLDQLRLSAMVSEVGMSVCDQSSITGFVGIQDMSGMTFGHATQFSPAMGKKAMTIWEDAYPARPKEMHFINMPGLMESIFALMKSFAKDKMQKRLRVHPKQNDWSSLHEAVGADVLPMEYGGTNGTLQDHIDALWKDMYNRRDWIKAQSKFKSNEKKRRGAEKTHADIFGMEGSFRQLNID